MNAEVGFNVGDEFSNVLGGSAMLPPGSLTLIGHPRGWNPKPLVHELVKRALSNAGVEPGTIYVPQLNAGDADFLEDKALPSLFRSLEPGQPIGFTVDCSSMLRPMGGKSINKTLLKVKQAATMLKIPAIVTLAFDRFENPGEEPLTAIYDTGACAAEAADLELFLLGQVFIENEGGWNLRAGKSRLQLTPQQRRLGLRQRHPI